MNKYTVDLAGMRVVQIASMEKPELDAKFINNAFAIACHIKADAEYQLHIRSLPSYPLQSVPEGWVQDMVVAPEDFEIGWQVYDDELRQWEDCAEWYYNSINGVRRIIAIPILQTGITIAPAADKGEDGTIIDFLLGSHSYNGKWFGDDVQGEPPFWWRSVLKEYLSSPSGKEDKVKCTHEALIIAGDATEVYYCPACKESWTKAEWDNINTPDSYWKKRAQAAEDVVKYWNSLGQVVRDDILHKWQSLVTSPVAETEGQDELWQQVGKIVMDGFDYSNQISVVAMLKDKFFIQPKNK